MTHWRDDLCMQLLGMRQLIRDIPDHEVPDVAKMLRQVEDHLEKLCGVKRKSA